MCVLPDGRWACHADGRFPPPQLPARPRRTLARPLYRYLHTFSVLQWGGLPLTHAGEPSKSTNSDFPCEKGTGAKSERCAAALFSMRLRPPCGEPGSGGVPAKKRSPELCNAPCPLQISPEPLRPLLMTHQVPTLTRPETRLEGKQELRSFS